MTPPSDTTFPAALERFAALYAPPAGAEKAVALPSCVGAADAFLALALARSGRVVLAVTPGIPDAERLADDLRLSAAETPTRILELPPVLDGDAIPFGTRLKTLAALRAWSIRPYPCVIAAAYPALATPVPAAAPEPLVLAADAAPSFAALSAWLAANGYRRIPAIERAGDYAVRGGIVDVWSPGEETPVRAEYFGDELESVRRLDPATQRSTGPLESAEFLPAAEAASASDTPGETRARIAFADLLPADAVVLALDHNAYDATVFARAASHPACVYTGDPPPAGVATYAFQTAPLPGFAELGADEAHHPELFEAARQRLERHLAAAGQRGAAILRADGLSGGFEIGELVVVTRADRVFTRRRARAEAATYQGARLDEFENLEPGEYVVHVDYGVGRYIGPDRIEIYGEEREVFTVEYADGARVHIPAAHAHLLSRYVGVKGQTVKLHRLDGTRWKKDVANAEKAVADLAAGLLETQARRETIPGFACDLNCDGLEAFESAFPYEETPDQAAAIAAVKRDLSVTKPMDRLVCGDAGYGKTEVAMRAAYVVAMNGRQVAVLAPTTVLAEQHFETFTARFDGTPIRVESVSRFQGKGEHRGTFDRLASGGCDIVIGTHAILSKRIRFHDLGLIIIDEEQRFGVRQKEFLKRLRATADVLTMSATPIPRTLYLSMTGARDLSLLRTPPRTRVAVETKIVRDADETVRAAIAAELARGGQVFFLHNRVASLERVERRLRALLPRARLAVAHGRMEAAELAARMRAFARGDYDILLSTAIVESGIDIPRANTILIDRADCFGLAELYQLRGRVGRAARQGHAYFLLPPSGDVDADARERLAALQRHGGLGAGFNLAVRDLELRGAGNLLGAQQSGHIAAVGFGLYCQLLRRTVARLKGEQVRDVIDVKVNIDFANPRLDAGYIEDDVQRLTMLKRFAEAQDVKEVHALAGELQDRFGPLPRAALLFVRTAELRVRCAEAGVEYVDVRGAEAYFRRAGSRALAFTHALKGKTPEAKLANLISAARGAAPVRRASFSAVTEAARRVSGPSS